MTKLEIAKLAWKVSDRLYKQFGERSCIKLMAGEFCDVLKVILEDYDITPKQKQSL